MGQLTLNGTRYEATLVFENSRTGVVSMRVRVDETQVLLAKCYPLEAPAADLQLATENASAFNRAKLALEAMSAPGLPSLLPQFCDDDASLTETRVGAQALRVRVLALSNTEGPSLLEWVKGPIDAEEAGWRLWTLIQAVAKALSALHDGGIGHFDVRATNIVVGPDTDVKLVDFDSSLSDSIESKSPDTALRVDPRIVPDAWRLEHGKVDRIDLPVEGSANQYFWLDWYALGLVLREAMEKLVEHLGELSPSGEQWAYLDAIATFLLDYPDCQKLEAAQVLAVMSRTSLLQTHPFGIEELSPGRLSEEQIESLPDGRTLPMRGIFKLAERPAFQRLYNVRQLSFVQTVYRGASHTRGLHMLHTAALMSELVTHLQSDPTFRVHFNEHSVRYLLAAALLHDINHIPFLHVFQEANIPDFDNRTVYDHALDYDGDGQIGVTIPLREALEEAAVDPDILFGLLYGEQHHQYGLEPWQQFAASAISSGVDVDKLSYLTLDSLFTGVPHGGSIDMRRIFQAARMRRTPDQVWALVFDAAAIPSLEMVIQARLANFRSIYWHPRNRSLMAMFMHVLDSISLSVDPTRLANLKNYAFMSDETLMSQLNERYRAVTRRISPMARIQPATATGVYREAFALGPQHRDQVLYDWLSTLARTFGAAAVEQQEKLRVELTEALNSRLRMTGPNKISSSEVLLDIPARKMDREIICWVEEDGVVQSLADVSDSASSVTRNFGRLARTVRIFVAPRVAQEWNRHDKLQREAWMRTTLSKMSANIRLNAQQGLT